MREPSAGLPPLSLYIHIPWCVRKCPYCDFNSHNAPASLPQTEYVDALLRDLDQDLPLAQGRPLTSIFFGGGTPSLFTPDNVARILDGVATRLELPRGIEVTLETNPGTVEHGPFAGYARAGVNALSNMPRGHPVNKYRYCAAAFRGMCVPAGAARTQRK